MGLDSYTARLSVIIALAGAFLAAAFDQHDWIATFGVICLTIAFSLYVGAPRLRALGPYDVPDFLTIFLLFQVLNKALTAASLVLRWSEGVWQIGDFGDEYRWQAEWVFFVSTILFWAGWQAIGTRSRGLLPHCLPVRKLLLTYLASTAAYIAFIQVPDVAIGGIALVVRSFALGVAAIMLYVDGPFSLGRRRSWIPLMMLVPYVFLSLRTGMKSEFLFAAFPILLAAIRHFNLRNIVFLVIVTTVLFTYIIPLTREVRDQVWIGGIETQLDQLNRDVASRLGEEGAVSTTVDSLLEFVNRASSAEAGGLVMYIAERDGHIGAKPLEGLGAIFIPRFLWPEKPHYAPGAWFTWYLGYAASPEQATSSTATMLGTELYWMFGWLGVIVGMAALGGIYAGTWAVLALGASRSIAVLAAMMAFLMTAARFEETALIYAISGPIIFLVYVRTLTAAQVLLWPRAAGRA